MVTYVPMVTPSPQQPQEHQKKHHHADSDHRPPDADGPARNPLRDGLTLVMPRARIASRPIPRQQLKPVLYCKPSPNPYVH